MHTSLLAASLTALLSVLTLPAQQVGGGPDPDRRAFTVVVQADNSPALAAVSIAYSPPVWHPDHDALLPQLKGGNYMRLGTGWWTTLETLGALEIGGTKIDAGSYYLGVRVDQDGAFSLLLFDSGRTMQKRLLPGSTPLYTGAAKADLAAPLTFAKDARKEVVAKLEIELTADKKDPAQGTLAIRWGRHEATAPVKFELGAGKAEADGRK